jgi:tRNA 2-thiouridine synthesizing protein A
VNPLVIDCRGQRCPLPILVLARRIGEVAVNDEIQIEADDPAARGDVAAWCRMRGHKNLGVSAADDGTPRYRVRRLR